MSAAAKHICQQLEMLNIDERIEVLDTLWQSLTSDAGDEGLNELLAIAESRSSDMVSGRVPGVAWSEVQKQLDDVLAS
jgi:putative addiction module component (TIGR02574 family)